MIKRCSRCKQYKPIGDFYKSLTSKSGIHNTCKRCDYEYHKEWKKKPHTKALRAKTNRKNKLKSRFGISLEQYEKLLGEQEGKCAICGSLDSFIETSSFAVDHNHKTGKVRGLLCRFCNFGIGALRDDVKILNNAIEYLKKYDLSVVHVVKEKDL